MREVINRITDFLVKCHATVQKEFEGFIARNIYLPVMGEGSEESFRHQLGRVLGGFEEDLREWTDGNGKLLLTNTKASIAAENRKISADSKTSTRAAHLWVNEELVTLAARVMALGNHFQPC